MARGLIKAFRAGISLPSLTCTSPQGLAPRHATIKRMDLSIRTVIGLILVALTLTSLLLLDTTCCRAYNSQHQPSLPIF